MYADYVLLAYTNYILCMYNYFVMLINNINLLSSGLLASMVYARGGPKIDLGPLVDGRSLRI